MPCSFVRLAGCPLRCSYCDTPQAIPFDAGEEMTITEVVEAVRALATPLVLVTGGEPLAQRNCIPLLEQLQQVVTTVQLETSGAYDISRVPDGVCRIVDIKTPSSGESQRNRWSNLKMLTEQDEVKVVIMDRADYEWAASMINTHQLQRLEAPLLFSPAWGTMDPALLCSWILEDRLPVRMQLQLHKYIWGAEATGV